LEKIHWKKRLFCLYAHIDLLSSDFFSLLRLGRRSGRERKRERERKGCFCKRLFFLLLAPGSALEKIAANVNPEGKP